MRIGVPKEIKNNENRVGLIPENVQELVVHGHEVWVETNAGQGIGADDAAYQAISRAHNPYAASWTCRDTPRCASSRRVRRWCGVGYQKV